MGKSHTPRPTASHTLRPLAYAAVLIALLTVASKTYATIQEESCIYPDVEYPLPCEDDD